MPRRISIRTKLAAALAVPLAGLIALTAFEVVDADRAASDAETETDLASAAIGPASLVSHLQNERNFTAVDLIGMGDGVDLPVDDLAEARRLTDAALGELEAFVGARGPQVRRAFADGIDAVENGLAEARDDVDSYPGPKDLTSFRLADAVFTQYSQMLDALFDGTAGIALAVNDNDLRTGVELVDLTTRLYELRSSTIRNTVSYVLNGTADLQAQLDVAGALAETDAMERAIIERAVRPYAGVTTSALNDEFVQAQESHLQAFAETGDVDITALLGAVNSDEDHGALFVRRQAAERLIAEANAVLMAADDDRRDAIVLGGSLVVAALALTALVSRSITRPLASLRQQAEVMAGERLPAAVQQVLDTPLGEDVSIPEVEPVAVDTRDEVRDVADALNVVQQSALDLAVEQAVLRRNIADSFVNMGRRNQNLLDRQLDFITDLERDEADPDTLASLFRLDHLATRMRRNAESLLRLAGSEPQRRLSAPVELGDVVRGALGEVEDYQRVQVRSLDAAAVPGGAGADLAHAVAELLENALSFSPPTEAVEVRGRRTPDGYVLAISDNGLGMTPDELVVANRRLAGEESFTVAPSRYLGHYVAGHLASRLGVRIELQPGPAGGLVARVDIPESLLVDVPSATPTVAAPASSARDEWMIDDDFGISEPDAAPPAPAAEPVLEPVVVAPVNGNGNGNGNGVHHEPVAGFGGLAAAPAATSASITGNTTPSGLVRRVPGAQRPATDLGAVRPAGRPEPAAVEGPSPDAVSSFLSDFSAGVARGIADARRDPSDAPEEDR